MRIFVHFCRIYDKKDNQFTLNLRYIYYRLIQIIYCDKLVLIYLKNTIHNLRKKSFIYYFRNKMIIEMETILHGLF